MILHQTSVWFSGRNPKFKGFFRPNLGNLQRKKKKGPISQIQTFEGGCFRMGGAIFHFSHKIGLKSTKCMRFCILHKPMGGARAPPPPPWLRYWSQRIRKGVANEEKNFNLFKIFSIRSAAVTLESLWFRSAFAIKLTETELRTHGDSGETLANARSLRAKRIKFKRNGLAGCFVINIILQNNERWKGNGKINDCVNVSYSVKVGFKTNIFLPEANETC